MCKYTHTATNLAIEPELLEKALRLSGEKTKKAAVSKALREFIARREQRQLRELFDSLVPDRDDHIQAADLRNRCRRSGVQIGTIDALLAQLCIHHDLTMLSTDADFEKVAEHHPLTLWRG